MCRSIQIENPFKFNFFNLYVLFVLCSPPLITFTGSLPTFIVTIHLIFIFFFFAINHILLILYFFLLLKLIIILLIFDWRIVIIIVFAVVFYLCRLLLYLVEVVGMYWDFYVWASLAIVKWTCFRRNLQFWVLVIRRHLLLILIVW